MAALALGFDCGPMSGFDSAGIDKELFAGTTVKSNRGTQESLFSRLPRMPFDGACRMV